MHNPQEPLRPFMHSPDPLSFDPLGRYAAAIESAAASPDPAQWQAAEHLQTLWLRLSPQLRRWQRRQRWPWSWLRHFSRLGHLVRLGLGRRRQPPKGLYLWGGVGRGKTWLMDMFYDSLPGSCLPGDCLPENSLSAAAAQGKRRTHFHRFMQEVHRRLAELQGSKAPLQRIAADIAKHTRVLCFDEFFVDDIGDAMILSGLLQALFARGVCLVATSNCHPEQLYPNGLQRQRFLPAIALLKQHTEVVELTGSTDYRLRSLSQARLYHSPAGPKADESLLKLFHQLTTDPSRIARDCSIEILARPLTARYCADDVIWFDFSVLCDGPRSTHDYIELAHLYHGLIVSNIPALNDSALDKTRRFISLVDELYDRSVKLILSAAAPLAELYQGQSLAFEFRRTHSRLQEMQSQAYLAACRHP